MKGGEFNTLWPALILVIIVLTIIGVIIGIKNKNHDKNSHTTSPSTSSPTVESFGCGCGGSNKSVTQPKNYLGYSS